MIELDGSFGEGGGQILRTALALSALTRKPLRIYRIRARRKEPGLRPQHLLGARAVAEISGGKLAGAELGATELCFYPGRMQAGNHTFDTASIQASAGSTGLIFQTILPPLGFAESPSRITLKGGTHVAWSPPADYIEKVFLPTIAPMGVSARFEIPRAGFYPIGGGVAEATVAPFRTPLQPLRIEERGPLQRLRVFSIVANLPLSIAKRQMDRATARLTELGLQAEGESRNVESPGKGTSCFILAEFEHVRAGFSALGEIGKRAEQVANEAVEAFLRFRKEPGALDPHLADQVVLYMALADGESAVTVAEATDHLRTNIWVIEQFLPVKFILDGRGLRVAGAALRLPDG